MIINLFSLVAMIQVVSAQSSSLSRFSESLGRPALSEIAWRGGFQTAGTH